MPEPLPQTPPSPNSPPAVPQPSTRLKIFLLALPFFLLFLAIGAWWALRPQEPTTPSGQPGPQTSPTTDQNPPLVPSNDQTVPSPSSPSAQTIKTRYEIDTNQDGIPDFVEEALGWDPTLNPCLTDYNCGQASAESLSRKNINVLFILDSSGSMAARLQDGEMKMEVAKRILKEYVERLPQNIHVALMVYGHQGSNSADDKALSCQGIDTLYPLGPVNVEEFKTAVDSFQPTGWTPIAGALLKAAQEVFVGKEEDNNFIVMVSDGQETCGGNPCGAAGELRNSNIQTTIDVVGLAVDQNTRAQLTCIADAGGGRYFDAQNSKELLEALKASNQRLQEIMAVGSCLSKTFTGYTSCYYGRWNKAHDYLLKMEQTTGAEKGTNSAQAKEIRASRILLSRVYLKNVAQENQGFWQLWGKNHEELKREMDNW